MTQWTWRSRLPLLIPLLAVACSSEGIRLPQSPLLASLERKSGRIVYVGPDRNIYTIDQGGGHQQAITEDAQLSASGEGLYYNFPTWSPISDRIAFVGFSVSEEKLVTSTLYIVGEDDEEPREIYASDRHIPFYLYWSPDGTRLSFLSGTATGGGPMALQVASVDDGKASVVDTGLPYYWAWSPKDQQMLTHVGGSAQTNPGRARLSFLQLGARVTEIGLDREPTNFQAPAFSPDGSYTLFASESSSGEKELLLASAAGEVISALAPFEERIAFSWAPKGDFVAYITSSSAEGLFGKLHFLNLRDPENPEDRELEAENVMAFFWAPDGKQTAYFIPKLVPTGEGGEAASEENLVLLLELYVAKTSNAKGKLIATFPPTEPFVDVLSFFDQYQRSSTIWSPDSNYLVIPAVAGRDLEELFIVPASGGFEPRLLTEGNLAFWSPQ